MPPMERRAPDPVVEKYVPETMRPPPTPRLAPVPAEKMMRLMLIEFGSSAETELQLQNPKLTSELPVMFRLPIEMPMTDMMDALTAKTVELATVTPACSM